VTTFRLRPVDVQFGGWLYRIEPRPAADWIEVVLTGDLADIFPGLLGDLALERDVWDQVFSGEQGQDDIARAAHEALAAAAGRPWWEAQRLIQSASDPRIKAVVFGALVRSGFDFEVRPLAAFLDAAYSFAVENTTEEQRAKLDLELKTPPPGAGEAEVYDDEEAEADFMAALGDTGARG
jgi:hypothetical protein